MSAQDWLRAAKTEEQRLLREIMKTVFFKHAFAIEVPSLGAAGSGRQERQGRRLHDRQIGGLGALQNLSGIDADLTSHVSEVGSVANQPAGCDKFTIRIRCRNPVASSHSTESFLPGAALDV
jgi:hypothetical protein